MQDIDNRLSLTTDAIYIEFSGASLQAFLDSPENLIIMHSFFKTSCQLFCHPRREGLKNLSQLSTAFLQQALEHAEADLEGLRSILKLKKQNPTRNFSSEKILFASKREKKAKDKEEANLSALAANQSVHSETTTPAQISREMT